MPFEEFPVKQPSPDWSQMQAGLDPDCGLENVPGFTKEAGNAGRESIMAEEDSLYANTGLLNETLELDRHIARMVEEEELAYVVMEKSLTQMGYKPNRIRLAFQRFTGIDPVQAYLDASNYPAPPGAIPRYVYGWGEAKSGSDHFFILPYTDKYALFRQSGLNRILEEEFHLLDDAREALAKEVKSLRDVTPDVADTLTDIFQKVASVGKLSKAGAEYYRYAQEYIDNDADTVSRFLVQAVESGKITGTDFKIIAENVVLASPMDPPPLTAPERVDEHEFTKFRDEQEGRSFREMRNNTLMPGQEFASQWQSQHKVDFFGLIAQSKELFAEIVSTVQGYAVEPSWGTFRIMPQPNLAVSDDNHILDGSVAVGATVSKMGDNEESEIAILMFIHNGKLKYSGKFRGVNDREYAFTTQGLDSYFEDLAGTSAMDENIGKGTGTPFLQPGPGQSF